MPMINVTPCTSLQDLESVPQPRHDCDRNHRSSHRRLDNQCRTSQTLRWFRPWHSLLLLLRHDLASCHRKTEPPIPARTLPYRSGPALDDRRNHPEIQCYRVLSTTLPCGNFRLAPPPVCPPIGSVSVTA